MDINSSKVYNKTLHSYCSDALAKLLPAQHEAAQTYDGEKISQVTDVALEKKEPKIERPPNWRHMSSDCVMEEMIIVSYGEEFPKSLSIVQKAHDNTIDDKDLPLMGRREVDTILDKLNSSIQNQLKYICTDLPRAQFSKEYYLDRIKLFLTENKTGGAVVWYTGVSEYGTGNWCFKDGIITFEEIFGLYMDHFKGKRLTVISDCSYSGQWIVDAANKMDEIGLPSCGHHTRREGLLLKVFASCQPKEEASSMVFLEGMTVNTDTKLVNLPFKTLESGQTPYYGDFRAIRCRKLESEDCELESNCTWRDRIISKTKNVYLVRGKDEGKPAWHFVLVDEEKRESFKEKIATGNIDVALYGRVIVSGWGKDPPKEKTDLIDRMFLDYIPPN